MWAPVCQPRPLCHCSVRWSARVIVRELLLSVVRDEKQFYPSCWQLCLMAMSRSLCQESRVFMWWPDGARIFFVFPSWGSSRSGLRGAASCFAMESLQSRVATLAQLCRWTPSHFCGAISRLVAGVEPQASQKLRVWPPLDPAFCDSCCEGFEASAALA